MAPEKAGDGPVDDVKMPARWTQAKAASDKFVSSAAEIGFEVFVDSMFSICCQRDSCIADRFSGRYDDLVS